MHLQVQPSDSQKSHSIQKDKGKQRDDSPQTTDIAEKLIAFKRRTAVATRPKDKSERMPGVVAAAVVPSQSTDRPSRPPPPPAPSGSRSPKKPHPSPQVVVHRAPQDPDADEFSRKLHLSRPTPAGARPNQSPKLYNPERDPIPLMRRTTEPESMSDEGSNSHVSRHKPSPSSAARERDRDAPTRQLFDHRKDDPVRFSVLARPNQGHRPPPTPKSSGEYVSASSTSSYAASQISSTFTLSSTTDGSSASSALFDQSKPNKSSEDGSGNMFAAQLKKLYRTITNLETKIKAEDAEVDDDSRESSRILLKGKSSLEDEDVEQEKWARRIDNHKRLVECIHNMLEISLAPSVPASLRHIPTKYNIIMRLWMFGFHKILESLRRASFNSPLAMELLQEYIYYAYTFYTGLYEEPLLATFRQSWLEALGDLARYRMAVAAMVTGGAGNGFALTAANVSEAAAHSVADTSGPDAPAGAKSVSAAARIDDSPSPSVGVAAARAMELEPEKERWRTIARDWYGTGLADQPGTGKLHHHLGLLSREVEGEELRGVYHFVKSMTSLHPFPTSRENILPLWSSQAQARRQQPDARASDLFVLLHGMLFTNIQLDDFQPTFSRFMERLELEGAEEREWIMMAVVNIGSVFEYGKSTGVLKRLAGTRDASAAAHGVPMRVAKREVDHMDVDDDASGERAQIQSSPPLSEAEADSTVLPMPFKFALQLTFSMLSYVLRHPTRKPSPFARSRVNPYLTILLTFLATVLKHQKTREVLERSMPWEQMVTLFAMVPRNVMASQGLAPLTSAGPDGERWAMLTSNMAPPLPEDWCLRGMEWVGRKVFQPGYWKSGEDRRAEIEVLDETEAAEMTDGHIEDDDNDHEEGRGAMNETKKRWVRVIRAAVGIAGLVDGLTWVEGTREWRVEGALSEKVSRWNEQDRIEKEEEERRRTGTRWADDSMDVDDDQNVEGLSEDSDDDDEEDSEEVKDLKARRRYLRNLLQSAQSSEPSPRRARRSSKKEQRPLLPIIAGYTVLVVDTNILLSSLSMFSSLVESMRWTIMVPLPVIMELDGLRSNPSQLGEAAGNALMYISNHIRSHSLSLKVQTSKGNYLTTLNVRTEEVDFTAGNAERNMDDLILKAAIWHDEHWIDRSAILKADIPTGIANPVKVVLLSLDRNLRLKARSRQLPAAGEKDLAILLAAGT